MKLLIIIMIVISSNVCANATTTYRMSNGIGPMQALHHMEIENEGEKVKVSFISDSYNYYILFDNKQSVKYTLDYILNARRSRWNMYNASIKIQGVTSENDTHIYVYIEDATFSMCFTNRDKCVVMHVSELQAFMRTIHDGIR